MPFAIGEPNTIAAPGVVGLPLIHSRRVIDGSGHIPAVDLDREAISRVTAWAAAFVLKGFYPIPSLVIDSSKHLRRPPPDTRRMINGSDRKESHGRKQKRSVKHPSLRIGAVPVGRISWELYLLGVRYVTPGPAQLGTLDPQHVEPLVDCTPLPLWCPRFLLMV